LALVDFLIALTNLPMGVAVISELVPLVKDIIPKTPKTIDDDKPAV
jgi:hypothetical protein